MQPFQCRFPQSNQAVTALVSSAWHWKQPSFYRCLRGWVGPAWEPSEAGFPLINISLTTSVPSPFVYFFFLHLSSSCFKWLNFVIQAWFLTTSLDIPAGEWDELNSVYDRRGGRGNDSHRTTSGIYFQKLGLLHRLSQDPGSPFSHYLPPLP